MGSSLDRAAHAEQQSASDTTSAALDDLLTLSQMQMELEESRTQGIHARGVGLGGFASVVLSLLTLALSSDVRVSDIPGAATYMLVGALLILAVAIALIVGVMFPFDRKDIRANDLDSWRESGAPTVRKDALRRLSEAIGAAQRVNRLKANLLLGASVLVVVAVALSAAAGAVIAL